MHKIDVYTTGQVAQICKVAPRTVTKWFDNGQLKGYRIPGSKDRRIPAYELLRFMKANNIPLQGLEFGLLRVLIVDSSCQWAADICGKLNDNFDKYKAKWADNLFDTGYLAGKIRPHVVILNLLSENLNIAQICKGIRMNEDLQGCKIIATAPKLNENEKAALISKGFDDVICGNADLNSVIAIIEDATNLLSW